MTKLYGGFCRHDLDGHHALYSERLPADLIPDAAGLEELWAMHPAEFHEIWMIRGPVKTPRWQQAYDKDYHYTGGNNRALPTPPNLQPYRDWSQTTVDARLNGLLVNWYQGDLGHYIGPHHDSTKNMVIGAPIVTISLGEERTFRLTHPKTKDTRDFPAAEGTVFVMPYDTNKVWKHQVPRFARWQGRRISITLRAFE